MHAHNHRLGSTLKMELYADSVGQTQTQLRPGLSCAHADGNEQLAPDRCVAFSVPRLRLSGLRLTAAGRGATAAICERTLAPIPAELSLQDAIRVPAVAALIQTRLQTNTNRCS